MAERATEIGERLRQARQDLRLSQEALGQRASVSRQRISQIEAGQFPRPDSPTMRVVLMALGYDSLPQLMTGRRSLGTHSESNVAAIVERPPDPLPLSPVYRWGAAGNPLDAEALPMPDHWRSIPPGKEQLIGRRGFAVVVKGESMARRRIHDGDIVWVNPDRGPLHNKPVLARLWCADGESGMVVKVYRRLAEGGEGLFSDGELPADQGHVLCTGWVLIGPVVLIEPQEFPPE